MALYSRIQGNFSWRFAFTDIAIGMHSLLKEMIDYACSGSPKGYSKGQYTHKLN